MRYLNWSQLLLMCKVCWECCVLERDDSDRSRDHSQLVHEGTTDVYNSMKFPPKRQRNIPEGWMLCGVVGMVLGLHFSSQTMYLLYSLRFTVLLLLNSFSTEVINYFLYRQKNFVIFPCRWGRLWLFVGTLVRKYWEAERHCCNWQLRWAGLIYNTSTCLLRVMRVCELQNNSVRAFFNTLRTGLLNCLNARSRGLTFRHRASCI